MKRVEIHADAKKEIREAVRYYNSRVNGLGSEFLDELEKSKNMIRDFP